MIGAVKRQCANMDRLTGLVKWLLRSEENCDFVFQTDILGEFRRSNRRIGDIAQLIVPDHSRGKAELRLHGSAMIQTTREKSARFLLRRFVACFKKLDFHGTSTRNGIIVGIGNDYPDGGLGTSDIRLL